MNKGKTNTKMNRWVTIYLPNRANDQYCTKDLGDSRIQVVDIIECDPGEVKIAYREDGKIVSKAYVGMPYMLEIF